MQRTGKIVVSITILGVLLLFLQDLHDASSSYSVSVVMSKLRKSVTTSLKQHKKDRIYNITWCTNPHDIGYTYDDIGFHKHPDSVSFEFSSCKYTNCQLFYGRKHVTYSDVVIFDARNEERKNFFKKPPGQVWVFSGNEAPSTFDDFGSVWRTAGWVSSFNWTMTYDSSNTDIHLPYGEIRKKADKLATKDYSKIFRMKNKTALIVHSHCDTRSRRLNFVKSLQKFIDIDSYGECGTPWNCGKRYHHEFDHCYDQINGYKFYLAFENAICNQYLTEKLYRNYNYDSIMVVRGGRNDDADRMIPKGTYIYTQDFKSIKELADYMKRIGESETLYTEMLKRKDEYYSIPYNILYTRAMCEICERMNNQDKYKKHIKSTIPWVYGKKQCTDPSEISDLNET